MKLKDLCEVLKYGSHLCFDHLKFNTYFNFDIFLMANARENVSRRRRVTFQQLESLWEFLNSHKDVAVGYNKSAQAREFSRRTWMSVAESLNSQGEGATKDWKGWSNYWVDYKAKLKRRVSALRASQMRTGGGLSEVIPLSDLEKKFLSLLGDGFGTGIPNVQVDPFPTLSQADNIVVELEAGSSSTNNTTQEWDANLLLHVDEPAQVEIPLTHEGVPSPQHEVEAPPSREAALTLEAPPSQETSQTQEAPHPIHRRRTVSRRGGLTIQAARQILVDTSQAKLLIEQKKSETLCQIAESLKEAVNTLNRIVTAMDKFTGSSGPEARNESAPDS